MATAGLHIENYSALRRPEGQRTARKAASHRLLVCSGQYGHFRIADDPTEVQIQEHWVIKVEA
jgi:hypothetical protein